MNPVKNIKSQCRKVKNLPIIYHRFRFDIFICLVFGCLFLFLWLGDFQGFFVWFGFH